MIRDAQNQSPEIVAMWREVNPNLSQASTLLSQCGLVASILNLAVSCIGLSGVLQRLEEIEQRLKRIEHKIELTFYADFRAALKSARNTFTRKNYDNPRAFAIQAVSGLNKAQEIYKDYTLTAFDNQIQVADEYLSSLFLAYVAEIICYLKLEEIEVTQDCLQKGKNILHPLVVKYIKKMLPSVDSAEWNKFVEIQPKVFLRERGWQLNKIPIKWKQL